jgi:hypothetical protein
MQRGFTHNNDQLTTRVEITEDEVKVGVHEASGRRRYGMDVRHETLSDMLSNPATSDVSLAGLMDQVERDYKRYVDEVLPAIAKAAMDETGR